MALTGDLDMKDESSSFVKFGMSSVENLGLESRSILKSILTEEAKLSQGSNHTRSDLHYFRARYNYYRLSLLRLPADERVQLEPSLNRFYERITWLDRDEEMETEKKSPAPFIHAVEKPDASRPAPKPIQTEPFFEPPSNATPSPVLLEEVVGQLQLVRLALTGEFSPEAKKILCDGIDRVISKIKTHRPS